MENGLLDTVRHYARIQSLNYRATMALTACTPCVWRPGASSVRARPESSRSPTESVRLKRRFPSTSAEKRRRWEHSGGPRPHRETSVKDRRVGRHGN
jgi:hypothetical protein